MYICLCNPFSDKDVKKVLASEKDASVSQVYMACSDGEKPQCCSCLQTLKDILSDHRAVETA